jgi:hypothetical protein
LLRIESRIESADLGYDSGGIFASVRLGIGGGQDNPAKVRAGRLANVEPSLFDRGAVTPLQVVSKAEGEAVASVTAKSGQTAESKSRPMAI